MLTSLFASLVLGAVLVVAPEGPYQTIPAALAAAGDGDTVEVRGGVHYGPFVLDRPVVLVGRDGAVLDGGGQGSVVTLAAPGSTLRGFTVRASGADLNRGDAGVAVRAAGAVVEDNRIEDALGGISLDNAPNSVVRNNSVRGKPLPIAERGDGLHLWYSSDVLVEGNQVKAARDNVIWYSARLRLLGNRFEDGRYGLHFMYDDDADIADNLLRNNSVGAYLMYSQRVRLRGNLLGANRGPSGFGLGLKDMDDVVAEGNWLVDNRVGVWTDTSPRSMDSYSRFKGNLLAFNDIAVTLQPSTQRNLFAGNVFRDNLQQVSVSGGGVLRGNQWSDAGGGNYWSDYSGFDADGDGQGDVPYRAEAVLSNWMDQRPGMRLFQFGLAAEMVEFAARAVPALRPAPKLVDDAPLLVPPTISRPLGQEVPDSRPAFGAAGALLGGGLGLLALAHVRPRRSTPLARLVPGPAAVVTPEVPELRVEGLTKRFGRLTALDGVTFSVRRGEIVALWGPNGAGKTTAIKCILGLLPCSGSVRVAGQDALRHGKLARRALGYVPQEVAFHDDLTVSETATFYSRLKRVDPEQTGALLERLGLAEHDRKPIGALSGGMRQRLALALALTGGPPVLVLDEPTSNLDAGSREQVLRLLEEQRHRGAAILFASHRLEEVEALADRVLVLQHGRLVFACSPHELADRLGLRVRLDLRVSREQREQGLQVLRAAGLRPGSRNGHSIDVEVSPMQKALPIRVLEQAGIVVADFSVADGKPGGGSEEDGWTS